MSINRIPFYVNEQYASGDLIALQRAAENAIEELAAFGLRSPDMRAIGDSIGFDVQPEAAVLGGLNAGVSGATLLVSPGLLCTTLTDAPDNPSGAGAYLALSHAEVTVPIPSPPGDTWYIVTGRPGLVNDAAVARSVFDPPNHRPITPTPNLVKRQQSTILFTVVQCTGADLLAVLPTNAVPLWGVFRPAGGGSIDPALHLVDLRPSVPRRRPRVGAAFEHNQWRYTTGLTFSTHVLHDDVELRAYTAMPLDPLLFVSPDDGAPAAGEWWYLYLARYRPLGQTVVPRHAQKNLPGVAQQGVLVLTKRAPFAPDTLDARLARLNDGTITLPSPFAAVAISGGDAVCFGALQRNVGNTGWNPAQCDGDRVMNYGLLQAQNANDGANFTLAAPVSARTADLHIECDSPAPAVVYVRGASTDLGSNTQLYRSARLDDTAPLHLDVSDIPLADSGRLLSIYSGPAAPQAYVVYLRGYRF